jgi:hypothetical protein
MVEGLRKMVRSVRRNEQEGVIFPVEYDQDTKQKLFEFTLLNSGGARQHNTDAIIRRYEERQLMTILADFIMVGHQSTGTYNLHVDKTGIFREALNATARNIAEVFNRHAIPRLFAANGWRMENLPKIVPSDVDAPNLNELSSFLTATAGLGFVWGPDADMEKFLRNAAGLPDLAPESMEKRRREARLDEAARYAEQQARYMAARSELVQAQAAEEAMMNGEPTPDMQAQQQQMAQGQQGIEQGKQQMQIGAAGEQRAQEEHTANQAERIMMAIGGGGDQKKGVKKILVGPVRR